MVSESHLIQYSLKSHRIICTYRRQNWSKHVGLNFPTLFIKKTNDNLQLKANGLKLKNVPCKSVYHFFFTFIKTAQKAYIFSQLYPSSTPSIHLATWFQGKENQVISQKSKRLQPCQSLCQWILTFLELGNVSLFCDFHQIWQKSCTSCL